MPRVLADGRTKLTILTSSPLDPANPTASELNAGIDMSAKVLTEGFSWTPADSDKVNEGALSDTTNSSALGRTNYNAAFTLWRYYLTGGGVDPTADAGFAAVKTRGTTLWGYVRRSDKLASAVWAAGDEIQLGAEFINDTPQDPGAGGWLKYAIKCEVQNGYPFITVAGAVAAAAPTVTAASPTGQGAAKAIVISGVRFTGTTAVSIGGTAATSFSVINDNQIVAVLPAGSAGSAPVIVTNATGASAAFPYTRTV